MSNTAQRHTKVVSKCSKYSSKGNRHLNDVYVVLTVRCNEGTRHRCDSMCFNCIVMTGTTLAIQATLFGWFMGFVDNMKYIKYFQTLLLSAAPSSCISLTALRTGCGPVCMTVPRNEWFRCWVMSSFILTLYNHSLPTAVQQKESVLLLSVIQQDVHITSCFISFTHWFILQEESRTYLWLKLLSFLRQWRVTTLWPSLLTSWLTVHTTGSLALAPRNATPSFSFTLQQKNSNNKQKNIELDGTGPVKFHSLTGFLLLSVCFCQKTESNEAEL